MSGLQGIAKDSGLLGGLVLSNQTVVRAQFRLVKILELAHLSMISHQSYLVVEEKGYSVDRGQV